MGRGGRVDRGGQGSRWASDSRGFEAGAGVVVGLGRGKSGQEQEWVGRASCGSA